MEKIVVTCRLDQESVAFLDNLGTNLERDRSYLIMDAVRQYIATHRWRMEEIQRGIAEADAGDFASDEEVEAMFEKLTK